MSYARKIRRIKRKEPERHSNVLANLLGDFYELLYRKPQPSDEEVREQFKSSNNKWKQYCLSHKLMNADHLFDLNVSEAWKRHTVEQPQYNNQ